MSLLHHKIDQTFSLFLTHIEKAKKTLVQGYRDHTQCIGVDAEATRDFI